MSVKEIANSLVGQAFEFLSSIMTTVTYHHTNPTVYTPSTTSFSRTDLTSVTNIGAVIVSLTDEELSRSPVGERPTSKCFIKKADISTFTPKLDDYITAPYGNLEILEIVRDPTESVVIFYVRGK